MFFVVAGKIRPANRQDLPAQAHGIGEISGDAGESGEKQVAEAVPAEAAAGVKNDSETDGSSALRRPESATMQLRMSPGGRML